MSCANLYCKRGQLQLVTCNIGRVWPVPDELSVSGIEDDELFPDMIVSRAFRNDDLVPSSYG